MPDINCNVFRNQFVRKNLITYVVFLYQFALHPPLKSDREINTQPIIDMNISALKLRTVFIYQKISLYSALASKMIAKVILVGLLLTTLSEAIPITDKEAITEVNEKNLEF